MTEKKLNVNGILVIYNHPYAVNAPTIMEHVTSFKKYSRYKVWNINVAFGFPKGLSKLNFSVIILHYSLFGSYPFKLGNEFVNYITTCERSKKIAFFQDEYQYCGARFELINHLKIDCIYTLLEPQYFKDVYYKYTNVSQVFHTLTGYVDDGLIKIGQRLTKPFEKRTIDVGYRARPLSYSMGKGAREKIEIAEKFLSRASSLNLTLDIGTEERDRIYGHAWYTFLSNCRATLGVESGVSIFDIHDEVRSSVVDLIAKNPNISFNEVYETTLSKWEDNIYYRMLSPRIFECAALRVLLILFEGRYTGIIKPMVHYIPLRKDFANFDEVISLFRDQRVVKKITDSAYDDLIKSGVYNYRHMISDVDAHIKSYDVAYNMDRECMLMVDRTLHSGLPYKMMSAKLKTYLHHDFPGKSKLRSAYHRLRKTKRQKGIF